MKENIPPVLLFLSVIIALFYLGSQMRPAATLSHFWLLVKNTLLGNSLR